MVIYTRSVALGRRRAGLTIIHFEAVTVHIRRKLTGPPAHDNNLRAVGGSHRPRLRYRSTDSRETVVEDVKEPCGLRFVACARHCACVGLPPF